jgi:uncharacterized protein (DUF2336 family)
MTRTLPLIDELEAALSAGGDSRRVEMLSRITDLFVGAAERYSEEQVGVFEDVMARLVGTIEAKARAILAQRLAPIANAPSGVIHILAFDDDIDVAHPVLQHSERLDDSALLANANTKSQRHLFAISQRRRLSEAVTDILVRRGDRHVVRSVANNAGALFSDTGFQMLVTRAANDDDLATYVGKRNDIPRRHFLVLLEKASATVRERLTAENPRAGAAIKGVVAEVASGIRDSTRKASPDFAAAQAAVEQLHRLRRIGGSAAICPRAQIRGDGDRTVDPLRHADRCRRAGAPRSRRGNRAHSGQGGGAVGGDHQGHLAVARGRPRHVGQGSRPGAGELQSIAAGNRPPGAQLLPHAREETASASGRAAGCSQRLALRPPIKIAKSADQYAQ